VGGNRYTTTDTDTKMMRIFALLNMATVAQAQLCAENEYVNYSQGQSAGDGACAACPDGTQMAAGMDASAARYIYNAGPATWADAEAACVAAGAHLTSIEDQAKQDEMSALAAADYWIGGFKEVGNTDGNWAWVDDPTTLMQADVGTWTPNWDAAAGGDGERVDGTGIQIYLRARATGNVGEWQFDRGVEDSFAGHTNAYICEAASCTPIPDVPCAGTWSACTAACEAADARTWDETTAQSGTGDACPAAAACAADDGGCVAVPCAGTWSACTAACEAADARTWDETTAPLAGGTACPAAAACAAGDDACPAADPAPAPTTSAATMITAGMAASAVAFCGVL
jgi:hypothetical protein